MKLLTLVLVATIALAGCSSTSTSQRSSSGANTTTAVKAPKVPNASLVPADFRAKIVAYAKQTLKDPYSIKSAEISDPREVFVGLINGGKVPGVCVRFNAKNSFGAYIGQRPFVVAFKNGSIFYGAEPVFGDCDKATYVPFAELENIS